MQYFEDIIIGEVRQFGSHTLTREETTDFAAKYDPQDFHLSDEAAAKTFFGRMSASGWNTAAVMMKLLVADTNGDPEAGAGGIGADELRWLKPVYPGDTLSLKVENLAKRRSRSRPEQGSIWQKMTVLNQHDEPVMTATLIGMAKLRDPENYVEESGDSGA
ncbi:MAG: MaoC family dehydratase [Novosphingobium sp.]